MTDAPKRVRVDWTDIGYSAELTDMGYRADFIIKKIISCNPVLEWANEDETLTPDWSKADTFCHGDIKWDGCSNYWFDEQDKMCIPHACSREDLVNLGILLGRVFDIAAEIMTHADREIMY